MLERTSFSGAGCRLSAISTDEANDGPVAIVLHGMRDHALSMYPLVHGLANYRVIAPDLRGHGMSDKPGIYTLAHFVADLDCLFEAARIDSAVLIGHSLGGHIVSRFTATYPERVSRLVLIDGMGPPGEETQSGLSGQAATWQRNIGMLRATKMKRAMPGVADALQRLSKNNPLLDEASARRIVENGVDVEADGSVFWKWDPAVDMVWSTFSQDEAAAAYELITCPVQVITGENSLDYWQMNREDLAGRQDLHDREIARKCALFTDAEHVVIGGAGHMIHYDEPRMLSKTILDFLGTAKSAGAA